MADVKLGGYYYEMTVDDKGFVTAMQKVDKKIDDTNKTAYQSELSIGKTLRNAFIAVTAAITGAIYAITKLVNAYQEQARAELKLQNAMKNTTGFVKENYKSFVDYANELQNLTGIEDDQILNLMAMAKMQGIQDSQMKQVIQTTLDLSAAFGIDQSAALKAVTGAYAGNVDMLQRYVKNVKQMKDANMSTNQILQNVSKSVAGQAQAFAETSGGASKLNVMMGELQESIGKKLVPVFTALMKIGMQVVDIFYSLFISGNALEMMQRKLNESVSNYNNLLSVTPEQINAMTASQKRLYDLQVKLAEIELAKSTKDFLDSMPEVIKQNEEMTKSISDYNEAIKNQQAITSDYWLRSWSDMETQYTSEVLNLENKVAENNIKLQEGVYNLLDLMATKSGEKMIGYLQGLDANVKATLQKMIADTTQAIQKMSVLELAGHEQKIKIALKAGIIDTTEYAKQMAWIDTSMNNAFLQMVGVEEATKEQIKEMKDMVNEYEKAGKISKQNADYYRKQIGNIKVINTSLGGTSGKLEDVKTKLNEIHKIWTKIHETTESEEIELDKTNSTFGDIVEVTKALGSEIAKLAPETEPFVDALNGALSTAVSFASGDVVGGIVGVINTIGNLIGGLLDAEKKQTEEIKKQNELYKEQKKQTYNRVNDAQERLRQAEIDRVRMTDEKKANEMEEQDRLNRIAKLERDNVQMEKDKLDIRKELNRLEKGSWDYIQQEIALNNRNAQIMENQAELAELQNERTEYQLKLQEDILAVQRKQRDEAYADIQRKIELGLIDVSNIVEAGSVQAQLRGLGYTGTELASQLSGLGVGRGTYQIINNTQYNYGRNGFQIADEFNTQLGNMTGGA